MSEYGEVLTCAHGSDGWKVKRLMSFLYFLFEACRTQASQYSISLMGNRRPHEQLYVAVT